MIILASKPPDLALFCISRDRAALPSLRSLSAAKPVGKGSQVDNMEDALSVVAGCQQESCGVRERWYRCVRGWM